MSFSKRSLLNLFLVTGAAFSPLYAHQEESLTTADAENFKAIREYVDSKRNLSIKEKGGNLRLGGDVRVRYKRVHQKADGVTVEGAGTGGRRGSRDRDIPQNRGRVEANLSFEYLHDDNYADILLKFSNNMGLDDTNFNDLSQPTTNYGNLHYKTYQPSDNKISLARAVIGHEIWSHTTHKIIAEIGRQRLYDLFDSRVMFVNRCDGLVLQYKGVFEGIGKAQLTYAGFVASDRSNHYVNSVEMSLAQVLDSPLTLKYAFADWKKKGIYSDGTDGREAYTATVNTYDATSNPDCSFLNRIFNYRVSQISASSYLPQEWLAGHVAKVYGAFLYNHVAPTLNDSLMLAGSNDRNQTAWYAGVTIGAIQKPSDWILDLNYQYVGAQSVPELETLGGAGRGNLRNLIQPIDPSQGYSNYKGFALQWAYCASAEVMFNLKGAFTKAADARLTDSLYATGRTARNSYQGLEAEIVYSF